MLLNSYFHIQTEELVLICKQSIVVLGICMKEVYKCKILCKEDNFNRKTLINASAMNINLYL